MQIFSFFAETIKRKKTLFVILIVLSLLAITLAIFAAININNGSFDINLDNIPYIKFLRNDTGLPAFIFGCFVVVALVYLCLIVCFAKPHFAWLGIIFYLYFVYSQAVVYISLIMIYGFFNVLLVLILLFVLLMLEFALFILIILEIAALSNQPNYFKNCFNFCTSKLLLYSIVLLCLIVAFCLITTIMRSFVVLLIY